MFTEAAVRSEALGLAKELGYPLAVGIMECKRGLPGWESIATGVSGAILFLAELYRQTGDPGTASAIDTAIDEVLVHCRNKNSYDHSLYTGRAGVVYALMQWYSITGRDRLLEDALSVAAPSNQEYLYSHYTPDDLYSGRAGTLLVLLHLFLHTKEPFLQAHIGDFAGKILAGVDLSADGGRWIGWEDRHLQPLCGMAHGSAGIRYVLGQLDRSFRSALLPYINGEADRYLNSCWMEESAAWGDYRTDILDKASDGYYKELYLQGDRTLFQPKENPGWADGTVGILFSGSRSTGREQQEKAALRLYRNMSAGKMSSNALYDGLAGLGLYLLQTGESWTFPILDEVTVRVRNATATASPWDQADRGLMHGKLGGVYFLLKAAVGDRLTENILAPFSNVPLPDGEDRGELPVRYDEIKKEWIRRDYPRTIYFLERALPDLWQKHFDSPPGRMDRVIPDFHSFIAVAARTGTSAATYERLADLYSLEKKKSEFARCDDRSALKIYLEEWQHHSLVHAQLNKPGDWLRYQKLRISDRIGLFSTRWSWGGNDDFGRIEEKILDNLQLSPDRFEYIVQISDKREPVELALKKDTMLSLHLFDTPKPVIQALAEIKQYILTLPEKVLQELLIALSESRNTKDFIDQLEPIFLFKIRQWVFRGILTVC